MKKRNLFTLFMCAVMALVMVGCSSGNTEQQTATEETTSEVDTATSKKNTEERTTKDWTLSAAGQSILEKYETMYTTTSEAPSEQETTTEQQPTTKEQEETTTEAKELDIAPKQTHTFKGSGDDVITGVKVEKVSFVRFICNGKNYTSVKAHYEDTYDLLVSAIGSYKGDNLLIPSDNEIAFEVAADGEWSLEIYELGYSSTDSFSGNTDTVTGFFKCTSDIYEITYSGTKYFSVKGYYERYDDYSYNLLANETDSYSGKVFFKKKGEYAFFEITGQGEWSIEPIR